MNIVDSLILKDIRLKANKSPRKRAHYNLHKPTDYLQRIVQVANIGTYAPPHRHLKKLELFVILRGRMAVIAFDDHGELQEVAVLGNDNVVLAEIPPGTWHSIVILDDNTSFVEIIEGYYDPATHKEFAPWAPSENTANAAQYLEQLTKRLKAFIVA